MHTITLRASSPSIWDNQQRGAACGNEWLVPPSAINASEYVAAQAGDHAFGKVAPSPAGVAQPHHKADSQQSCFGPPCRQAAMDACDMAEWIMEQRASGKVRRRDLELAAQKQDEVQAVREAPVGGLQRPAGIPRKRTPFTLERKEGVKRIGVHSSEELRPF